MKKIKHTPSNVNISGKLRHRLLALLVVPMLIISLLFSLETYWNAQSISKNSFDESLTILTLAIMAQSENTSGDSLPENTLELIQNSIGDVFFYHIVAPQGGFVTGYTNKPEYPDAVLGEPLPTGKPTLFDSVYQGEPVRAALYRQYSDNPIYTGWIELTVWRYLNKQYDFQHLLFTQSVSRLSVLISFISLILWFGIRYGLKPLERLQNSIAKRSINDLSAIKSPVPFEVKALVESMNDLFSRLTGAIEKREAFLGNASHQLKTPLARIRTQAEIALRNKSVVAQKENIQEVIYLTRHTSRLINQMLSLLRAESDKLLLKDHQALDLNALTRDVAKHYALDIIRSKRELIFEAYDGPVNIHALPIMLTEAISNLVENAMAYSHPEKDLTIRVQKNSHWAEVWIIDKGPGIASHIQEEATHRFYRIPGTKATGCGLGLAIVTEIVKSFNGELFFDGPTKDHFAIGIRLPLQDSPPLL